MNNKRILWIALLVFISLGAVAISVSAATITGNEGVYNQDTISPFGGYFENQNERIDMNSGALAVGTVDLSLPGRGGLDLVIGRTYTSNLANLYTPECDTEVVTRTAGYTYYVHQPADVHSTYYIKDHDHEIVVGSQPVTADGKVYAYQSAHLHEYYSTSGNYLLSSDEISGFYFWDNVLLTQQVVTYTSRAADRTHTDLAYQIGVGWCFNLPSLEPDPPRDSNSIMPFDISLGNAYLHLGDGSVYKIDLHNSISHLKDYYLKDLYFESRTGNIISHGRTFTYKSRLLKKDGTAYYFDGAGRLVVIENRFKDSISFYRDNSSGDRLIITDTVGRVAEITFTKTKVTLVCGAKTIDYNLSLIEGTKYKLDSVVYHGFTGAEPGDRITTYTYNLADASFDFYDSTCFNHTSANNKYLNLIEVSHPTGGSSTYAYQAKYKRINPKSNTDWSTMTEYRICQRFDSTGGKKYNVQNFAFGDPDGQENKTSTAAKIVADWDTSSQACGLTEKYVFNKDNLLIEKWAEGDGFKEAELTTYAASTKMPTITEIRRYDGFGTLYDKTKRLYAFDDHRNLLNETYVCQENGAARVLSEEFNEYDNNLVSPLTGVGFSAPKCAIKSVDATTAIRVDYVLDTLGRVAAETKSRCQYSGASGSDMAQGLPYDIPTSNGFWPWMTPHKADSILVKVYWRAPILGASKYKVFCRRYYESAWQELKSVNHYAGLWSIAGNDQWTLALPGSDIYEIKVVRLAEGQVKVDAIQANITHALAPIAGETVTTAYEYYGDTANVRMTTTGSYVVNYEYDSAYNAYPGRIYANGIGNPDFGPGAETVEVRYSYDEFGRQQTYTDGLGHVTEYAYDNWDRVIKQTHAVDGTYKTIDYFDSQGKVIVLGEEDQGRRIAVIYRFDGLGRPVSTAGDLDSDPLTGNVVQMENIYNSLGQVWQEKDAEGHITSYYYDPLGRLLRKIFADGTSQRVAYDDRAMQQTLTDANGNQTLRAMDRLGRIISQSLVLSPMTGLGLQGDYYDNADLTGFKLTRKGETVNFDWGTGSPDAPIGADTFSIRWTGEIRAHYSEEYTFFTLADDGVRLVIDGQSLVDKWTGGPGSVLRAKTQLAAGQKYPITLEYTENTGSAQAKLYWWSPSMGMSSGLDAEYYGSKDLTNLKTMRVDTQIDNNWGTAAPSGTGVGTDNFSVRWTGFIEPQYTENYTFYSQSDDGVRLWVNGVQLVNNWTNHSSTENSGTIALTAGLRYEIKMEYFDNTGTAVATLSWSSPSQAKQVIPASRLFHANKVIVPAASLFYPGQEYAPAEIQTLASYEYDLAGQAIKFTDGNGQITEMDYGLLGVFEERFKKADGTQSALSNFEYEYDALGNVTRRYWQPVPGGTYDRWSEITYDQVGRPIKKTYSWTGSSVIYRYDAANNLKEANYASRGAVSYDLGTAYEYTPRNCLDTVTQAAGGRSYLIDYNTNAAGQITGMTYPGSSTNLMYDYDLMGRLTNVREASGAFYLGSPQQAGIQYKNTGFVEKMVYGNGLIQTLTPDTRNRVSNITLAGASGPALLNLNYTLDGEGNVLAINGDSFTYDRQNRLTAATVIGQGGQAHSYGYTYDPVGNRLTSQEDSPAPRGYTVQDHNLLTQAGDIVYTYDSLGNTIGKTGGWEYIYDEENRLVQVRQNGAIVATYWYDAAGMRVRTDEGGSVKYYVHNGLNVIQEQDDATGALTDYIFAGSMRVASKAGTEVRYFQVDHLGSTRVITDAAGAVVGEFNYSPFGTPIGLSPAYGFTGKPEDIETGLQYFGARYFDADIGRFTSVDPGRDGVNWFAYCSNNPLSAIDTDGRFESPWYLLWFVPGQVAWDNAMTAFENGQYLAGVGHTLSMVAEQIAFAFSFGQSAAASKAAGSAASGGIALWSGGRSVMGVAAQFASKNGLKTLEQTATGKLLGVMQSIAAKALGKDAAYKLLRPLWDKASASFIKGTDGVIHIFLNAEGISNISTFMRVEWQLLKDKGYYVVFHFVKVG